MNTTYIWLKINDDFGFVAVSSGPDKSCVDTHIRSTEIDKLLGVGALDYISNSINEHCEKVGAFELTDDVKIYLENLGWVYDEDAFKMNADIQAPAFRKNTVDALS